MFDGLEQRLRSSGFPGFPGGVYNQMIGGAEQIRKEIEALKIQLAKGIEDLPIADLTQEQKDLMIERINHHQIPSRIQENERANYERVQQGFYIDLADTVLK